MGNGLFPCPHGKKHMNCGKTASKVETRNKDENQKLVRECFMHNSFMKDEGN